MVSASPLWGRPGCEITLFKFSILNIPPIVPPSGQQTDVPASFGLVLSRRPPPGRQKPKTHAGVQPPTPKNLGKMQVSSQEAKNRSNMDPITTDVDETRWDLLPPRCARGPQVVPGGLNTQNSKFVFFDTGTT